MEAKFYTTNQNIVVQEPLSVLVLQVGEFILQAAYEFLRSTGTRFSLVLPGCSTRALLLISSHS